MKTLQEMLESILHDQLQTGLFIKTLLRRKFAGMGLALSNRQVAYVARRLRQAQGQGATIRINEKHLLNADAAMRQGINRTLSLSLGEDDFEGTSEEIGSVLSRLVDPISEKLAAGLLRRLKRDGRTFVQDTEREYSQFRLRLAKTWRKGFYLLDLFLGMTLQSGADFNRREGASSTSADRDLIYVLTRLHARACQVSGEIITLLKAGFADGAHARWRTLHEIAVVSTFIAKHGTETARRYLAHEAVESHKAARQYQEHCHAIGYQPLDAKEMTEIQNRYKKALTQFGDAFRGSYGWAASALKKSSPTFRDVEQDVKLNSLSPYYRFASHNVHANPKGLTVKLGLGPDHGKVLLAGPSNTGLADPAQCTALSLLQSTSALLGTRPNLDFIVVMKALIMLQTQIARAFAETQRRVESKKSATVII